VPDAGRELSDGGEALRLPVLRLQVLAIRLQHDRELEVHDLIDGGFDAPERPAVGGERRADHFEQAEADPVHGGEHVLLGQGDADVDAADARPPFEVRLVVGAEQHPVEPSDERLFEPSDLRGAAGDGRARIRMGFDGGIEIVDDPVEVRGGARMELAQRFRRLFREADVDLQALEESEGERGHRFGRSKQRAFVENVARHARDFGTSHRWRKVVRARCRSRKHCAFPSRRAGRGRAERRLHWPEPESNERRTAEGGDDATWTG
jgi:hypothetical protein